jgi:hypothetical protein
MTWFGRGRAGHKPRPAAPAPPRFEDCFETVRSRVDQIVRAHDQRLMDDREADPRERAGDPAGAAEQAAIMAEAGRLWDLAQPADPRAPTDRERDRLQATRHLLGWLHSVQFYGQRQQADLAELAQAVLLLGAFADTDPQTIPAQLGPLIGAGADPGTQVLVAEGLLAHILNHDDPAGPAAAVELLTRALGRTPADHPDRAARLATLAAAFAHRAETTGDQGDVDAALQHSERALAEAAAAGLEDLTGYRQQLGALRQLSLRMSSAGADVYSIVPKAEHIVITDRATDRAGTAADLDHAIQQARLLIEAEPLDPAGALRDRAAGHLAAYARDGLAVSLEAGLHLLTSLLPVSQDQRRAADRAALGTARLSRFTRSGNALDLDLAIGDLEQALAITSDAEADRFAVLTELVTAYQCRWDVLGQGVSPERLTELARLAQRLPGSQPAYPVRALTVIGQLAQATGAHDVAARVLGAAVRELPAVTRWGLAWSDKEHDLAGHAGLVQDAIAAHLEVKDVEGALVSAELGRGVLLAAQLELRTDLTDLRQQRPDLADRFERMGAEIDAAPATEDRRTTSTEGRGWLRHRDWTVLLNEIRSVEGFERFLLEPTITDLVPADTEQTVVLINVGLNRADAILLPPAAAAPIALRLDHLSLSDVQAFAAQLAQPDLDAWGDAAQRPLADLLSWLWETTVEPVLTALGHVATPEAGRPWPRVCWIPTGLLGLMPFHAAGSPGGPATLDRVISSYSPTVRALQEARRRPPAERRQLSVALQHTPGRPDLPGTVAEARALPARHPGTPLIDADATAARVLAGLKEASWVHFACHAENDVIVPSRSELFLHDRPLPLLEIAQLRLPAAELAYLSACSTAGTGWRNADEALHLASAFQVAGYRHVIATLWPVDDDVAARAAQRFYELLASAPNADGAAAALHQVTRELRARYPDQPQAWAPLVHSGG